MRYSPIFTFLFGSVLVLSAFQNSAAQVSLVRNLQDAERGRPVFTYRPSPGHAQPPLRIKTDATTSPTGISPARIRRAYGFSAIADQGAGQTIGIVDAFDDPNIAADFTHFNSTFGTRPVHYLERMLQEGVCQRIEARHERGMGTRDRARCGMGPRDRSESKDRAGGGEQQ